jgi:hypothetical protein
LMWGAAWRTTHLTVSRARFQLSDVQVLLSWNHRLRISALLSLIRGLPIVALPWMLDLWSSRRTVFVEAGSRWIFSSAAVYLGFFETILFTVWRSLSVNVDFRPQFLFADVVFPWFVYSYITSETVAVNTPNYVAVLITDAPAKRAPMIGPLSKSDKSPIFIYFPTDCHSTQPQCTYTSTTECKQTEEHWMFFRCSEHNFYSSIS